MKLKTFHHIWQNLFSKILVLLLILPGVSFAQKDEVPGVLQSFEKLINNNKTKYLVSKQKNDLKVESLKDQGDFVDMVIDPFFMNTLLFRSEKKFLKLLKKDECSLAALLHNNLLNAFERPLQNLLVQIKNKNGKNKSILIDKDEYLEELYKTKCSTNKELNILYSKKNIKKTIHGLKFEVPKTKVACEKVFQKWVENINTPYLCKIPNTLKRATKASKKLQTNPEVNFSQTRYLRNVISQAKMYKKEFPLFVRSYLSNLCDGLEKVENFCLEYLAEDAWTKIINGELPNHYLSYKCKNFLDKDQLLPSDLQKCADTFNKKPDTCINAGSKGFPSFFPHEKCDRISETLNIAGLKTDYHDCPGRVDNEAITNVHRIIMHLNPSSLQNTPESCMNETHQTFARMAMNYNKDVIWPLKICFFNPAKEVTSCESYIPGNNFNSPDSENMVISSILKITKGAPDKMKCHLTSTTKFNPLRLQYQVGCFIVYDPQKCTSSFCPRKIYWNKNEVKGIRYVGSPNFSYFPTSLKESGSSVERILERVHKFKNKPLKNLTEIARFFNKKPHNILHGVGCIEDILPQFYSKSYFNGCRPIPFILDGNKKLNGDTYFSVRLPIDDIHSPRLLNWNKIFNAVNNYKKIHPMDTWTLNGLVKSN